MIKVDWRKMLLEALPAVGATAGGLYTYKRKGSMPLALLGALGGYGLVLVGRKAIRWVLAGTSALPTATAELPKSAQSAPAVAPAPMPAPAPAMSGLVTMPDGSTREAHVSVLDDAEDGTPRGGQILPFAQGGKK